MSMHDQIQEKLNTHLKLSHIEILNESHMHNVPPGSESHFKVVLVSSEFANKLPVKRHQLVYKILSEELRNGIHALALHTYTPEEWLDRSEQAPASPNCKGGE